MGEYSNEFIMLPKVDFAFKEMMSNEVARNGFLQAVLNTEIKHSELMNTNLNIKHEDEKYGILDVRVWFNDDTECEIEMQTTAFKLWDKRVTFYLSKMVAEQTNISTNYSNLHKCISISVLDFKYIEDDRFHTSYHIREDRTNTLFTDIMEWHIIELPKLPLDTDGTTLYNWAKFLSLRDKEDMAMIAKQDIAIGEAFKQLEIASMDTEKRLEYNARLKAVLDYNSLKAEAWEEGLEKGIAKGMKEGLEKGKEEAIKQLIDKWKDMGMSEIDIERLLS